MLLRPIFFLCLLMRLFIRLPDRRDRQLGQQQRRQRRNPSSSSRFCSSTTRKWGPSHMNSYSRLLGEDKRRGKKREETGNKNGNWYKDVTFT